MTQLLAKIPRAISETGSVTVIGNAVRSLVGGLAFYVGHQFMQMQQ